MIAQSEVERRLLALIAPIAGDLGLGIVRLRLIGSKRPRLQVMAERLSDGGMNVENCARLSRGISRLFDEIDPIDSEYTLEVSSPGIDRPLTRPGDFGRWAGHLVRIEMENPIEGRKRFSGTIDREADGVVWVTLENGDVLQAAVPDMARAVLVMTDKLIDEASLRLAEEDVDNDMDIDEDVDTDTDTQTDPDPKEEETRS